MGKAEEQPITARLPAATATSPSWTPAMTIMLVVLAALVSVIGLFYYMRIARAVYMTEPDDTSKVVADFGSGLTVIITAAMVVLMGLWPTPWFAAAEVAAAAFFSVN